MSLLDLMGQPLEAGERVILDRPLLGWTFIGHVWRGELHDGQCQDTHQPGEPSVICCWFDGVGDCQGAVARSLIERIDPDGPSPEQQRRLDVTKAKTDARRERRRRS